MFEPLKDLVRRQKLDPGGGEFDGERHALKAGTNLRDCGRVIIGDCEGRSHTHRTRNEQADRCVLAESFDRRVQDPLR